MMRLFLTGSPGVGKTTLIRVVIARLEEVTCAGFYTEEKRQNRARKTLKQITGTTLRTPVSFTKRISSLPAVKLFGIFAEKFSLRLFRDILPTVDRRNNIGKHAVPMRIIRGKKNLIVADPIDHIGQGALLGLSRVEPIASGHIFTRFRLEQRSFRLPLLPLFIHPVHPVGNPSTPALEKSGPQLGKFFRDSAIGQRSAVD